MTLRLQDQSRLHDIHVPQAGFKPAVHIVENNVYLRPLWLQYTYCTR